MKRHQVQFSDEVYEALRVLASDVGCSRDELIASFVRESFLRSFVRLDHQGRVCLLVESYSVSWSARKPPK